MAGKSRRKVKHSKAHPGFKKAAEEAARKEKGYTVDEAAAAIASASRNASAAAKRKNPRLKRVKGKRKRG